MILTIYHGILLALLPSPERERLAWRAELNPSHWSFGFGMIEMVMGLGLWIAGAFLAVGLATGDQLSLFINDWAPGMGSTPTSGIGLINFLSWFVNPISWPFTYLGLSGLVRVVAYGSTGEAIGEPLVILCLRLFQWTRRVSLQKKREESLGERRPDQLIPRHGGGLTVLTNRTQTEWTEYVTIKINERYYKLEQTEERWQGKQLTIAYLLRERASNEIIRSLVDYTED